MPVPTSRCPSSRTRQNPTPPWASAATVRTPPRPGVLERQLQAIAHAEQASEADVWVMAPMISTAEEAARFASMCAEAGIKTPGVMVEVPSAALTAESILREVGFASLGTNDLTQYAMAADRQLGSARGTELPVAAGRAPSGGPHCRRLQS